MSTTLALHTLRLSFQHWKSTYYLLLNGTIHISFCFYLKSHWCGQKFRPSCVFISLDKTLEGARTKAQQRKWERLTCIIYNLITLFFFIDQRDAARSIPTWKRSSHTFVSRSLWFVLAASRLKQCGKCHAWWEKKKMRNLCCKYLICLHSPMNS